MVSKEALGILKHKPTVTFSVTAVRANAACKLTRLGVLASGDAKAASTRRAAARFGARARQDWWYHQSAAKTWGQQAPGAHGFGFMPM